LFVFGNESPKMLENNTAERERMKELTTFRTFLLGLFFVAGMFVLGYLLSQTIIQYKEYERTIRVKGLSEREFPANIVIWPIQYTEASNDLTQLYQSLETTAETIRSFLQDKGLQAEEISVSTPFITDKLAQRYGNSSGAEFRYTASQTVTVYSKNIDLVREAMRSLSELGKQGIVFSGDEYTNLTEYLFTELNTIKPEMIEEATTKAREVAQKFAADSNSKLGKSKTASQGQFSITARDKNNPHIKKIRVVSTIEYYLSD